MGECAHSKDTHATRKATGEKQDEPWRPLVPGTLGTRNIAAVRRDSHAGTSYYRCDASHLTDAVEAYAREHRRVIAQIIPTSKADTTSDEQILRIHTTLDTMCKNVRYKYTAATIGTVEERNVRSAKCAFPNGYRLGHSGGPGRIYEMGARCVPTWAELNRHVDDKSRFLGSGLAECVEEGCAIEGRAEVFKGGWIAGNEIAARPGNRSGSPQKSVAPATDSFSAGLSSCPNSMSCVDQ
jgi:hypothetical protein